MQNVLRLVHSEERTNPKATPNIKLNVCCILKYLMDSSTFCWVIDAFVGFWVMTNLVTRLVAKARVDLAFISMFACLSPVSLRVTSSAAPG